MASRREGGKASRLEYIYAVMPYAVMPFGLIEQNQL
jgi:hypothetical protein